MQRLLRIGAGLLLALLALTVGGAWVQGLSRHADAAPEALALLASGDDVRFEERGDLVLRPVARPERGGLILYPGAYVDVRGYLPTLRPIAAAGYRVVIVRMPLDAAFFGIHRAIEVIERNPEIRHWVLAGHSLGGAMAGFFAAQHAELLDGLIIWDSYPAGSAAQFPKPVWHVHRATPDGKPPASFDARRNLFPPSSVWVPIPGGIHMYFGSFEAGGYQEDWAPSISREAQHRSVIDATLRALAAMEVQR